MLIFVSSLLSLSLLASSVHHLLLCHLAFCHLSSSRSLPLPALHDDCYVLTVSALVVLLCAATAASSSSSFCRRRCIPLSSSSSSSLSSRSATSSDPRPHDTGVVDPRVGIVTGIEGGRGLWGLNIIGARCERKNSNFLPNSASKRKWPNLPKPLQCRRAARWDSQWEGGGVGVGGEIQCRGNEGDE